MTISRAADKFALRATPSALHLAIYEWQCLLLLPGPSNTQQILASDLSRLILLVLNAGQVASGKRQLESGSWQVESSKVATANRQDNQLSPKGRRTTRLDVLYFFKAKNTQHMEVEWVLLGTGGSLRSGRHGLCALHACNVQKRRLMPH